MAQHDYNIANAPGASVRADLNAAFEAVASSNAGASAPSTTFANQLWYDSTNSKLKIRNPANTAWIELATVSGSTFTFLAGVLTAALAAGVIGTTQLATDAVTTVKIANDQVTNAKLANMATARIKGRTTASTGDPEDLTGTQVTAMLDAFTGDGGSGGVKGLVPAPGGGDAAAGRFLSAAGSWAAPGAPLISGEVTGSSGIELDLSSYVSIYRGFTVYMSEGSVSNDQAHVAIRTSTDGGANWAQAASDYHTTNHWSDGGGRHDDFTNEITTSGVLAPFIGSGATEGFDVVFEIFGMTGTTQYKRILARAAIVFDIGAVAQVQSAIRRNSAAAINALLLRGSSGTISCKYAVYGIL